MRQGWQQFSGTPNLLDGWVRQRQQKEGGPSVIPLDSSAGTTATRVSLVQVDVQCVAQRSELQMN